MRLRPKNPLPDMLSATGPVQTVTHEEYDRALRRERQGYRAVRKFAKEQQPDGGPREQARAAA